ncbi:Tubulin_tyrosine ligase [Hexamita inflata]|uniref:Tubulin tyrosine ligase n=1 Tax=Hexamita inflata TaxID=28002 RepID=A0AA86REW4_9EUKA|nr:Tubulin tyrosine ligase [Hexamita inflata]
MNPIIESFHKQSEALVSEPVFVEQAHSKQKLVKFVTRPHNPVLMTRQVQLRYDAQPMRLRVFYQNNTSSVVRKAFANAGFVVSPNIQSANVVWARPGAEQSFLMPSQTINQIAGQNIMTNLQRLFGLLNTKQIVPMRPTFFGQFNDPNNQFLVDLKKQHIFQMINPINGAFQELDVSPMLYKQKKFDVRIFVFISKLNPLSVYVFREGLVYVADQEFSVEALSDQSYFPRLNLPQNDFGIGAENEANRIFKLSTVLKEMKMEELGAKMKEMAKNVIWEAEPHMFAHSKQYNCKQFGIFGLDFEISSDKQIYLKQVSASIDFKYKNKTEQQVKVPLLLEALEILGLKDTEVPFLKEEIKEEQQVQKQMYLYEGQYYQVDPYQYETAVKEEVKESKTEEPLEKEEPKPEEVEEEIKEEVKTEEIKHEETKEQEGQKEEVKEEEKPEEKEKLEQSMEEPEEDGDEHEIKPGVKPEVAQYGLDAEMLKKTEEERFKLLPEKLLYDYKVYSHLINELRAFNHKFANIDITKLTDFEKNVIREAVDEMSRAKFFEAVLPTESVEFYDKIPRRYLNELIGCVLKICDGKI